MTEPSMIEFRLHTFAAGSDEGGRVLFQRMLSALIAVEYKTATDIRPDPGDWRIDERILETLFGLYSELTRGLLAAEPARPSKARPRKV